MAIVGRKPRWDALPKWRSIRKVSPGQIRIRILQLCILFTVPQLTLHAGVAPFVL